MRIRRNTGEHRNLQLVEGEVQFEPSIDKGKRAISTSITEEGRLMLYTVERGARNCSALVRLTKEEAQEFIAHLQSRVEEMK